MDSHKYRSPGQELSRQGKGHSTKGFGLFDDQERDMHSF